MLAIELSASKTWAREMRGTMSMAKEVAPRAAMLSTSSLFCAGWMKERTVCWGLMSSTSWAAGLRTLRTMSAPSQTEPASTRVAPASV